VLRSEGVLPGFTVRCLLPEHQKPWLLAGGARRTPVPAFPTSTDRQEGTTAQSQRCARLFERRNSAAFSPENS
jgi:hypothetical protein